MALLPIRKYGDPILRRKSVPVAEIEEEVRALAGNMIETMYASEGIGLSASQVGQSVRLIVVDKALGGEIPEPVTLVNPEVFETSGQSSGQEGCLSIAREEGCLSIPDVREEVVRPDTISVRYQTPDGESVTVGCNGLLARVIQHEVDHLDGVLFVDRISPLRRQLLSRRLRKMASETQREMDGDDGARHGWRAKKAGAMRATPAL